MKKIKLKEILIGSIIILLPIILGIVYYNQLPDKLGIHFDVNNKADTIVNKNFALFGIPVLLTCLHIFCCILNDVSDKYHNKKLDGITKSILPIISVVVYVLILLEGLDKKIDISNCGMLILASVLIILGNYIPKTDVKDSKGFNLCSLIKNEKKYNTYKWVIGYTFILTGLIFVASIFIDFLNPAILVIAFILITFIEFLVCILKK